MSKQGKIKSLRKVVQTINHSQILRTNIPAGCAVPSPPLGPQLGEVKREYII